jgi:adenosylmethionine-8-amino-7-oxononanoate aminotransferase
MKQVVNTTGYWVEYSDGQRHIDIQSGNSAYILGYNDQDIKNAMKNISVDFLRGNTGESSAANDALSNLICEKGNFKSLAWAVSGSDAVEAAISMNDHYWARKREDGRQGIISLNPSYHGTTALAKHLTGLYPYMNRARVIPAPTWRDPADQATKEHICLSSILSILKTTNTIGCIIFETAPWVEELYFFSENWWRSIRKMCDDFDILMIVDDVALSWGKLGTMYGWQKYGVQPDIVAIGKSLTAGYSPLSAAVCNQKVHDKLYGKSFEYGHTWSPSMQGVAAALAATTKIESMLDRVPVIEASLKKVAIDLGLNHRFTGLYGTIDTPKKVSLARLSSAGLAATLLGFKGIKIIAPLIADEEYFATLKQRLENVLTT